MFPAGLPQNNPVGIFFEKKLPESFAISKKSSTFALAKTK